MTFAEYNTDENFKGNSTADELVKIGFDEGKTREDIEKTLSPLWKEDKNGNVKKALDKYYKVETPKEEEKPKEEEVTEKVTETTAPKKNTVNKQTEEYMNNNNAISYTQEDAENKRQSDELGKRWDTRLANIDKMTQSMKNIDDHMVDQLPTFFFKRYANGEFGDPKGSDAKLRLAHFMLNGVQTKLKNASNAAMIAAGKSPIFADTTSDYEKYQQTNFAQGMENRWNKYKQETQAAIDLAKQGGMSEEALTDSIATISSNNRLQSAFNQMNERQKVFALQVLGEIGGKLGNMNDEEFVNTLFGMSAMGQDLDYKEAAAMLIYRTVKDPEKRNAILSSLGFDGSSLGGSGILGGLNNALTGGNKEKEDNPETTLEDGTNVDAGKVMTNEDYDRIKTAAEKLGNQYYNGEIDEEKFRSEYSKLEAEMKKHGVYNKFKNIQSQDAYLKQIRTNKQVELSKEIDSLNAKAKAGDIKPSEYEEQFKALKEQSAKWGASEKDLKSIEKGKIKSDTILKAAEKKSKKK